MDFDALKAEFEQKVPVFKRLEDEALFILNDALGKKQIKVHFIGSRVKSAESFLDKVKRKECKKPFEEIRDIVGLRVICLFLSDIPRVGEVLRSSFEVLSEDNKIEDYEVSSFGYLSVHFIAKMKREFAGPRYDEIKRVSFEIQVRTMTMDAWATISHYLDYKSDRDVPKELRRDFYALSGLFYVADTHFETFFKSREESRATITKLFQKPEPQLDQEINLDSLTAYLHKKLPNRRHAEPKFVSELIGELSRAGYSKIRAIEDTLEKAWQGVLAHEKTFAYFLQGEGFADVGVVRAAFDITDHNFLRLRRASYEVE